MPASPSIFDWRGTLRKLPMLLDRNISKCIIVDIMFIHSDVIHHFDMKQWSDYIFKKKK